MKGPSDATRAAAKDYEQQLLKLMTGYPPDPEVAAAMVGINCLATATLMFAVGGHGRPTPDRVKAAAVAMAVAGEAAARTPGSPDTVERLRDDLMARATAHLAGEPGGPSLPRAEAFSALVAVAAELLAEVAAGRADATAIGLAMNKAAFATAGVSG